MNESKFRLLDLPNEILLIILQKLNNIDVLYLLWNINNKRLNSLAEGKMFSSTLDFASSDRCSLINQYKFDEFCVDVLPRIHLNVQCLIVEPMEMERILLATDYPNLIQLKLVNFEEKFASHHFTSKKKIRWKRFFLILFYRSITPSKDLPRTNNRSYFGK